MIDRFGRQVWREQQRWKRYALACRATEVIRSFALPVGPRVRATQRDVAVLIIQDERGDGFHQGIRLTCRAALLDLLAFRAVRLRQGPPLR